MTIFSGVLHHLHLRKRVHKNLEQYPNPDKFKAFLDKIIYFVGISGPLMTIPQVITIYTNQSSAGISGLTWSWYFITAIIWLLYAIVHKEKPLIVTNSLWILIEIIILIQIFILYPN